MLSRRTVLAGAAAAAALPALPSIAVAQPAPLAIPGIRERTQILLAALPPELAAAARFDLGGETWRSWNYFGTNLVKPGARFEQMGPAEREAGTDLLYAMLSPSGFEKVDRVRALQDVLRAMGIGAADRNSDRYSFAIFNEPSPTELWGLRFEGHHLTLSLTLRGDEILSVTPSAFSCWPNDVTMGPYEGSIALAVEEGMARTLFADLSSAIQANARINGTAFRQIMAIAGRENIFAVREGIPAADMTTAQQDLLWQIAEAYAAEHWPEPIASAQRARLREGDREAVHFAWAGDNIEDTPLYYRLHGDSFVMELATVDTAAQHLHTIYHDTERTLGLHVL
jgi:hypothetical protein